MSYQRDLDEKFVEKIVDEWVSETFGPPKSSRKWTAFRVWRITTLARYRRWRGKA